MVPQQTSPADGNDFDEAADRTPLGRDGRADGRGPDPRTPDPRVQDGRGQVDISVFDGGEPAERPGSFDLRSPLPGSASYDQPTDIIPAIVDDSEPRPNPGSRRPRTQNAENRGYGAAPTTPPFGAPQNEEPAYDPFGGQGFPPANPHGDAFAAPGFPPAAEEQPPAGAGFPPVGFGAETAEDPQAGFGVPPGFPPAAPGFGPEAEFSHEFPGQAAHEFPGQAPGQIPGEFPGQALGEFPGQLPHEFPGQAPAQGGFPPQAEDEPSYGFPPPVPPPFLNQAPNQALNQLPNQAPNAHGFGEAGLDPAATFGGPMPFPQQAGSDPSFNSRSAFPPAAEVAGFPAPPAEIPTGLGDLRAFGPNGESPLAGPVFGPDGGLPSFGDRPLTATTGPDYGLPPAAEEHGAPAPETFPGRTSTRRASSRRRRSSTIRPRVWSSRPATGSPGR
ncbi:hypothetical protein ACFQ9X_40730 [Catenulispora yoronensis]